MTEKDKVQGKIARITEWSSGKGYFLNLENDKNDYYGFMKCKGEVGCFVELEVSEGTGNFADKVKIDKLHSKQTVKETRKETADKDIKLVEDSIKSGENTYFERQNLIIRQTCIKAASNLVGELYPRKESIGLVGAGGAVIETAERFYAWVTETDQRLPEPPEEP